MTLGTNAHLLACFDLVPYINVGSGSSPTSTAARVGVSMMASEVLFGRYSNFFTDRFRKSLSIQYLSH